MRCAELQARNFIRNITFQKRWCWNTLNLFLCKSWCFGWNVSSIFNSVFPVFSQCVVFEIANWFLRIYTIDLNEVHSNIFPGFHHEDQDLDDTKHIINDAIMFGYVTDGPPSSSSHMNTDATNNNMNIFPFHNYSTWCKGIFLPHLRMNYVN